MSHHFFFSNTFKITCLLYLKPLISLCSLPLCSTWAFRMFEILSFLHVPSRSKTTYCARLYPDTSFTCQACGPNECFILVLVLIPLHLLKKQLPSLHVREGLTNFLAFKTQYERYLLWELFPSRVWLGILLHSYSACSLGRNPLHCALKVGIGLCSSFLTSKYFSCLFPENKNSLLHHSNYQSQEINTDA